jgi:hypothetical protein
MTRGELITGPGRQQAVDGNPYGEAQPWPVLSSPGGGGLTWADIIAMENANAETFHGDRQLRERGIPV